VGDAMPIMSGVGSTIQPITRLRGSSGSSDSILTAYHQAKYDIFLRMTREQLEYRGLMEKALDGLQ